MRIRAILLLAALPFISSAAASLSIFPPHPVLYGPGARQRIVVTWTGPDGIARDVTSVARLRVAAPEIAGLGTEQTLHALTTGTTRLEATYDTDRVSAT